MAGLFGFGAGAAQTDDELPDIYSLNVQELTYVETDTMTIFSKILTDVVERTQGIADKALPLLWDNCLKSSTGLGLISLLAESLTKKSELFLVYDPAIDVLRKATSEETVKIREDYKAQAKSDVGVYLDFRNYVKTDMIKLWSTLDYNTVGGMYKAGKLSEAIQFKIKDLRSAVSLNDTAIAKKQAKDMASHLKKGKDILLDAGDSVESAKPDMTPITTSMDIINQRRSLYLGLPASYLTGEQTGGLNADGGADAKAVERGLKPYYFSIIKPVIESIFGSKTSFKTQDFDQIAGALNALKTFEVTSDEYLSQENKRLILARMLDLDEKTIGDDAAALANQQADQVQADAAATAAKNAGLPPKKTDNAS